MCLLKNTLHFLIEKIFYDYLRMGLLLLTGCFLIAFGPAAIFFITTVTRRPYLLVVSLLGYFDDVERIDSIDI